MFGCLRSQSTVLPDVKRLPLRSTEWQEQGSPTGRMLLTGVIAHADSINVNNRLYPKGILMREAQRFHEQRILTRSAYGELSHPSYSAATFREIDQAALSHQVLPAAAPQACKHAALSFWTLLTEMLPAKVLAVWWEGAALHGIINLLDTPAGRLAALLLGEGQCLGASIRCWTSLQRDRHSQALVVQNDCQLITCA